MLGRRATLALPLGLLARPAAAAAPAVLSAAADAEGRWRAAAFGLDGVLRFEIALPARGHGAALAPDRSLAVLFARRPGSYALVVDPLDGRMLARIDRPIERWFCGHGTFSADGRLLYATEIDGSGEGVVGVYAATTWRRLGEFPTGGADPHDIRLTPDGGALWVANGGIRTDPRLPRVRFELEHIESTVVRLDTASGAIRARLRAGAAGDLRSLRHLALGADGTVFVAMQHEGPKHERPALVAATQGDGLVPVQAEAAVWRAMNHYTGSAAATLDGALVSVTSPRGGVIAVIDANRHTLRATVRLGDTCGVAGVDGRFVVTSGLGRAVVVDHSGLVAPIRGEAAGRLRWDNHLLSLET